MTTKQAPEPNKKTKNVGRIENLRPGQGRPKGTPNRVTRELAGAAKEYSEEALETLIRICRKGRSEAARVAAACAILDRAWGKPKQQIQADVKGLTLEQLVLGSFKHEAPDGHAEALRPN